MGGVNELQKSYRLPIEYQEMAQRVQKQVINATANPLDQRSVRSINQRGLYALVDRIANKMERGDHLKPDTSPVFKTMVTAINAKWLDQRCNNTANQERFTRRIARQVRDGKISQQIIYLMENETARQHIEQACQQQKMIAESQQTPITKEKSPVIPIPDYDQTTLADYKIHHTQFVKLSSYKASQASQPPSYDESQKKLPRRKFAKKIASDQKEFGTATTHVAMRHDFDLSSLKNSTTGANSETNPPSGVKSFNKNGPIVGV